MKDLTLERFRKVLEKPGYFSLSKEKYEKSFQEKSFRVGDNLKQGNFGDCYFVAALYTLSRLPYFEVLIRAGMKKNDDNSWQVRLPLLEKEGKVVEVA